MADRWPPWPAPRTDLAPLRERLARQYRREHAPFGTVRGRLLLATADVELLLKELQRAWDASDGFLEAIGKGVLTIDQSPTGRRRLRELAAEAHARKLAAMNRTREVRP